MHGLGNDFVVLDARADSFALPRLVAQAIADRHTGVGCDQILLIESPRRAAAACFLRFLNSDGSEPESCGNGTRCVAELLMAERGEAALTLETLAGLLTVTKHPNGTIFVDMGPARLAWRDVPLAKEADTLAVPAMLADPAFSGEAACCSMGNPHATFFFPDLEAVAIDRLGPALETHALFPARANIGFAEILGRDRMKLRIWERGSGRTLACGSAACAAVVAGVRRGLTGRRVEVVLERGSLQVEWLENGNVLLGGPTATSFTGTFDPALFSAIPILQR